MDDIRLKTAPFEWRGETIRLRCNMNVLADVQEMYGGDISKAFNKGSTIRATLSFLTAMINDATDGSLTVREVGRELTPADLNKISTTVLPLVTAALKSDGEKTEKKTMKASL